MANDNSCSDSATTLCQTRRGPLLPGEFYICTLLVLIKVNAMTNKTMHNR